MSGAWGAVAQVAGDLLSGYLQREHTDDINLANYNAQKEFAQQGIRWKVEDARAAGLHPLFALGGAGASFSPSFVASDGADRNLGQNLARAATAFSGEDRELQQAQLEAVRAATARDYAQAAAFDSEAARTRQGMLASNPVAQSFPVSLPGQWAEGFRELDMNGEPKNPHIRELGKVAPTPYGDAYLSNAEGPAAKSLKRWAFPGFGEFLGPDSSSFGESMESIENKGLQFLILMANLEHYGKAKASQFVKSLSKSPYWSAPWETAAKSLGLWLDSHRR